MSDRERSTTAARDGWIALVCWAIHGAVHVWRGSASDLVWGCNVGALLIAVGLVACERSLVSTGTFWLAAGTPLWLMDLVFGGERLCSSLLVHIVVLALGVRALVRDGLVEGAFWRALLGGALLQQCTRWLTHWSVNINVSYGIYAPFRRWFSDYSRYWLFTFVYVGALYFAFERLLRWHRARSQRATQPATAP